MMLKNLFQRAQSEKFALGAFNVSTLDQVKAVLSVAAAKTVPVILELSPGEAAFLRIEVLAGIRDSYRELSNIFLNLDHAHSLAAIKRALDVGFDMVHFDGSELTFSDNIKQTQKVVALAKDYKVLVEGEIDLAGGHSTVKQTAASKVLTDPEKAAKFVCETGVDILACFFGNLHGVYSKELTLDFSHFSKIKSSLGSREIFFSLHGGSGVNIKDLTKAAKQGIVKVNFNTELRQAWAESLRKSLTEQKEEIVPYKILPPVIDSVERVVERKLTLLSTVGD